MYSEMLILQLHQCPHLSETSLSMWVCANWWQELETRWANQDHTNRISCICTLKKRHTKKIQTTMSSELAGKHLCNGKQWVWFELWNVICFHVGVTFIIHKHQMPALFNRLGRWRRKTAVRQGKSVTQIQKDGLI